MDTIFEESQYNVQLFLKLKRESLLSLILNTKPNSWNEKEQISPVHGTYHGGFTDGFTWNYSKLQKLNDHDLAMLYIKIVKTHEKQERY